MINGCVWKIKTILAKRIVVCNEKSIRWLRVKMSQAFNYGIGKIFKLNNFFQFVVTKEVVSSCSQIFNQQNYRYTIVFKLIIISLNLFWE